MKSKRYCLDHEKYGPELHEFSSLEEAQETIRACGPEFKDTKLRVFGLRIMDQEGDYVGSVED